MLTRVDVSIAEPIPDPIPTWSVVAASVQGTSHARQDLPCQDAHAAYLLPDGTLIALVADGAGSAERAEEGAQAAVAAARQALEAGLQNGTPYERAGWQDLLQQVFVTARQSLEALAEAANESLRLYATTLTCCVVTPGWLAVGQLGDGSVVAGPSPEALLTATRLQRGEYANETHFLTEDDALEWLQFSMLDIPVRALALMSDGLIRLALSLPSLSPHQPFFAPLFRFAAAAQDQELAASQLAAFLSSERVCARTDDDKTLVLAVRTQPDLSHAANSPADQENQVSNEVPAAEEPERASAPEEDTP